MNNYQNNIISNNTTSTRTTSTLTTSTLTTFINNHNNNTENEDIVLPHINIQHENNNKANTEKLNVLEMQLINKWHNFVSFDISTWNIYQDKNVKYDVNGVPYLFQQQLTPSKCQSAKFSNMKQYVEAIYKIEAQRIKRQIYRLQKDRNLKENEKQQNIQRILTCMNSKSSSLQGKNIQPGQISQRQQIYTKILSDEMYLRTLQNLNVNTQEEKAAQQLLIQLQHYIHGQHEYEIIFKGIQCIFRKFKKYNNMITDDNDDDDDEAKSLNLPPPTSTQSQLNCPKHQVVTRQRDDDDDDDEEKPTNISTHYKSMLTHPCSIMHHTMLNDDNNAEMSVDDEENEQDDDEEKFEFFDMTASGNKQNKFIKILSVQLDEIVKQQMSIAIVNDWNNIKTKLKTIIQHWFNKQQHDNETINKDKFYGLSRLEMMQKFFHFVENYKLGIIIPKHTTINNCPAKGFCRLHTVSDELVNKLAQEYLYGPHNNYKTNYTSKTHYICWISLWNNHQCGEYGMGTPAIIQGSTSVAMKHVCKVDDKGELNLCPHSKDWTVIQFIFKNIFYSQTWQTIYYNHDKRRFDTLVEQLFKKCTFSTKLLNESIKSAQKKNYYYPTKSQKRKQKKNPPQHRYQIQPNQETTLPPPNVAPLKAKISPNKDQKTKPKITHNRQDIIMFSPKSKISFLRPKLNGKVEIFKARKCFQNNDSYWNLYETLSPINVSIFNRVGKINCHCYFGKEREEECQLKVIGYVAIPVGDLEKFYILRSPLTKCSKHYGTISKLYGFANYKEKLYLGLYVLYIFILLLLLYIQSVMMIRPIAHTFQFISFPLV